MPKTRYQKESLVEKYQDLLASARLIVIIKNSGLTNPQTEAIRQIFFDHQQNFLIVKNSLFKLALAKLKIDLPTDIYSQPLAVAITNEDEVMVAKDISKFERELEKIQVIAGIYEQQVVDSNVIQRLASLPAKEQLLALVVGTIQAPLAGLVRVIQGPISGLLNCLTQLSASKK